MTDKNTDENETSEKNQNTSEPSDQLQDVIQFPDKGFASEYSVKRLQRPSIVLIVKRNVVSPILIRNTEDGRAETQEINGSIHAQANAEKFVSKERLTGLDLLRSFESSNEIIHEDYVYNEPDSWEEAVNLDPLTYGVSGTGGESFGVKSHVTEGYVYSSEEYNYTKEETRNAVTKTGSMTDFEDGEWKDSSTALYSHTPIKPQNSFVHFITIEASLPGMLTYVMHNVLNTGCYGARETRHGRNIRNEILGVIQADHPVTLSNGEWLYEYYATGDDEDGNVTESVAEYVSDVEKDHWDVFMNDVEQFADEPDWFVELREITSRKAENAGEKLQTILEETTLQARDDIGA